MSKRIQSHSATTKNSLFHQGMIKMLVIFSLNEVQRPWDWLIQSLKPKPQETKSKIVNENITTSRGKKVKIDKEIDVQFDPDIKEEPDEPEDYTTSLVQSLSKEKKQSTGKRVAKGKK
jgi:hypothetical protein